MPATNPILTFCYPKVSVLAAVPVGALSALLTRQTGRVKFTFDDEAMEVFIQVRVWAGFGVGVEFKVRDGLEIGIGSGSGQG